LATVSGDSVALAGATGASSEQAPRSASSNTMTPNLIAKPPAAAPICRKRHITPGATSPPPGICNHQLCQSQGDPAVGYAIGITTLASKR
jgi:hypothetical protein